MKHLIELTILLLALLLPTTATAQYVEVDGIFYYLDGNEAIVAYTYGEVIYTGDVIIPASIIYNGTTYSVTSIGFWAFFECGRITSITIPNSVTSIGEEAFYNCSGLTSLNIPKSVTSIGNNAFGFCSGLTSIQVEIGNTVYDSRDNCDAIIETASNRLITGCNNTSIPNSVTSIGDIAFATCKGLTSVNIPSSVTHIGNEAFLGCSGLTSVNIGNSVTDIGYNAFWGCCELNDVYCHISNPSLITMGRDVFYCDSQNYGDRTLHVPVGSVEAYQADTKWSDYFGSVVEILISGDANGDGEVSIADVSVLIDYLLHGVATDFNASNADVNGNGKITIGDVSDLIDILLNGN